MQNFSPLGIEPSRRLVNLFSSSSSKVKMDLGGPTSPVAVGRCMVTVSFDTIFAQVTSDHTVQAIHNHAGADRQPRPSPLPSAC